MYKLNSWTDDEEFSIQKNLVNGPCSSEINTSCCVDTTKISASCCIDTTQM